MFKSINNQSHTKTRVNTFQTAGAKILIHLLPHGAAEEKLIS